MRYSLICFLSAAILLTFAVNGLSEAEIREENDLGSVNSTTEESITILEGSLSQVDVSANIKSSRWAGIYGNASGRFVLGDEESLFSWDSTGARYVYLSQNGINFTRDWESQNLSE